MGLRMLKARSFESIFSIPMSEIIFKKRQSLWIEASLKAVEEWADHLLQALGEVKVLVQPRPVLVMMHARDSVEQEVFCVGEILVTECQIACRGQRFWGRVVGDQPLRALCLAIFAAAKSLKPEAIRSLEHSFSQESHRIEEYKDREKRALGTTRVQFETMTPT